MNINEQIVKGKWSEIKGEIQRVWGKLTPEEIEQTHGDIRSIEDLVHKKYGEDSEQFEKKFLSIVGPRENQKLNQASGGYSSLMQSFKQ